jgi:outer membrane protein assembly factor BamE (lipoprotein component of BamABCDE complex)
VRSTSSTFRSSLSSSFRLLALALAAFCLGACIYKIDIQQGNLLKDTDIERVQVGMTRSQVQFLLGTPMVADSFHRDRWDYAYYMKYGRTNDTLRRWLVVYFENERVARIERNIEMQPS